MVVTALFRVDIRPYSGYGDPALPIASWIAQGGVAGDASGGAVFMDFPFQRDQDAQISELFNLEQLSFDTSTDTNREVILETVRMDNLAQNRPASPQKWQFRSEGASGTVVSAMQLLDIRFPLWLGAPNRDEGNSGLRLSTNNVDLLLYAATLQGYMWGPQSILAPGGPQRPVAGLFR